MTNLALGPERELLSVREHLDRDEVARLQATGTLVIDTRRRRPLYFDGRFLAARDLTREQGYFLARQADLGRAGGAGVVHGLIVQADSAAALTITAGQGITPSGELVALPESLRVDLADIAVMQRLDASFGLLQVPSEPARSRSGLFVVALRPVEFSANPIAAYPTSVDGPRNVQDGDIVEGTAVTLIPYGDPGGQGELNARRAHVARDVFVDRVHRGLPAGALPLAMIALDRGVLQWVDPFLVRREVGAEHGDVLGLGFSPRALREAHLLQYEHHLREVLNQRRAANRGDRFPATEHFVALPPAGRLPAAAISPADFTQVFFPPEVDVELSVIPEDEVISLLEDSLLLQPIDLTASHEELDALAVLVLVPVPRPKIRLLRDRLGTITRPLKPAAPGLVAMRRPLETLRGLTLARATPTLVRAEDLIDAAWRSVLAEAELLWYTRRRSLKITGEATATPLRVHGDEFRDERDLVERLKEMRLYSRFHHLKTIGSAEADAEMVFLLTSPKFVPSRTLVEGALYELSRKDPLDRAAVMAVAQRYADPRFGEGIVRLETAEPTLRTEERAGRTIARAVIVPELDRAGRELSAEEFPPFASQVASLAGSGSAQSLVTLVNTTLEELGR